MARYYEEETLFQSAKDELLKYFSDSFVYTSAELFHKVLANTPTADVAPKSEVKEAEAEIERLKHILDCYALQYGTVMDKYIVIEGARAEVAREIFEEIEKLNRKPLPECKPVYIIKASELAELKKKYTEEK